MTTMNAKAELENRRLEPSNTDSSNTMDSAAEVLQSLGDNQQAESGGAAKEEAPPKKEAEENGSAGAEADSETAAEKVKSPETEEAAPPAPPKDEEEEGEPSSTGERAQAEAASKGGEDLGKRYLPEHKKPDAAPTFPEKVRRRGALRRSYVRMVPVDIWLRTRFFVTIISPRPVWFV
jgi:hypothetical protein